MDMQIKNALKNEGLLGYFNKLAPSHKKEYLSWINGAKKESTRITRMKKMCEMLQSKRN